jgi:hypothetical protein
MKQYILKSPIEAMRFLRTPEGIAEIKSVLGDSFRGFLYEHTGEIRGLEFSTSTDPAKTGIYKTLLVGGYLIKDNSGGFMVLSEENFTRVYIEQSSTN